MGFFVVYAIDGKATPIEGDAVSSAAGWSAWQEWASDLGEDFPNTARLAEDAEVWPASALSALEKELQQLARDRPGDPSDDVLHVGAQLLAVLRERPKKTVWVGVSDGEPGDSEEA